MSIIFSSVPELRYYLAKAMVRSNILVVSCLAIGIDEAGYGPTLGPLVIGATVFKLPHAKIDLWKSLRSVISPVPCRQSDKLLVCDSKKAYQPSRGIGVLEKTVLSFLKAQGLKNPSWSVSQLIQRLDPLARHDFYYHNPDMNLPLVASTREIRQCGLRLKKQMADKSVKLVQVICRVVGVAEFNRFIKDRGNKSDLLFAMVGQLLTHIHQTHKSKNMDFYIGKQGGRTYYRGALTGLFGRGKVKTIKERSDLSVYRIITRPGVKTELRFIKDAEAAHCSVALASMYAKYLREVSMKMFNSFYRQYMPGLKPTAGYPEDARRFLKEISPVINRLKHSPEIFIRAK